MPTILCLETSTDICSVCIARDHEIIGFKESGRSFSHTALITLFIQDCMQQAGIKIKDLDAVAVGIGPGSYTALRIGLSTAKGICYAQNIPLIALDTLEIVANGCVEQAGEKDIVIPMIDARRKEVYMAVYDKDLKSLLPVKPVILEKDTLDIYEEHDHFLICGDGADKAKDIIHSEKMRFTGVESSSKWMVSIAHEKFFSKSFENIAYCTPNYFKAPNITQSKKKLF